MANKNIYQKIAGVMEEVKYIQKTGYNSFHKYKYAKETDYIEAIRPALLKHGLVVIPQVRDVTHQQMNNGDMLTTVDMLFTLVNADNPAEKVEFASAGTGTDKGDKGLYKAFTGAKKYFIGLAFLIETGDDPEADETTDKRAAESKPLAAVKDIKPAETTTPKLEAKAEAPAAKKASRFVPSGAVKPAVQPAAQAANGGDEW